MKPRTHQRDKITRLPNGVIRFPGAFFTPEDPWRPGPIGGRRKGPCRPLSRLRQRRTQTLIHTPGELQPSTRPRQRCNAVPPPETSSRPPRCSSTTPRGPGRDVRRQARLRRAPGHRRPEALQAVHRVPRHRTGARGARPPHRCAIRRVPLPPRQPSAHLRSRGEHQDSPTPGGGSCLSTSSANSDHPSKPCPLPTTETPPSPGTTGSRSKASKG